LYRVGVMNCDEFETRIQELLDRRQSLTGDGRLLDHALTCTPCAAMLETYQELFDQIARWQPLELDRDFSDRTVRKAFPATIAVRSGSSGFQHRYLHQVLTVLACLVLLAGLGRFWLVSVATNRPISDSEISAPQSAEIAEHREHRAPVADPANDRWRVFWTEWSSVLPAEPLESLDTWTQGIKPIAASLNTALDSLRSTFPLYDPSRDLSAAEDSA
jgi:hypothetical protein